MNALHRIHAALEPGGLVVDTQPISPRPPVETDGAALGTLDMCEWRATIETIDGLVANVVDEGLYALEEERDLTVADAYDSGPEFVDIVGDWKGTRIPPALMRRLMETTKIVRVHQQVRLRVYRSR